MRHLVLLLLLSCASIAQQQAVGSISGRVLDNTSGIPVEGAEVILAGQNSASSGIEVNTFTDKDGVFLLTNVPIGKVAILASKEKAGYPNLLYSVFGVGLATVPQVDVSEGQTTTGVLIRINKGGTLIGHVQEAATGNPIPGAQLRLYRLDNPLLFLETRADIKGDFRFVLPSIPYALRVSELGYEVWESSKSNNKDERKGFLLLTDERRDIVIKMAKRSED